MLILRDITAVFLLVCLGFWLISALYVHIYGYIGTFRKLRFVKNKKRTRVWMNYRFTKKTKGGLDLPTGISIDLAPNYDDSSILHEVAHILIDTVLLTAFGYRDFFSFCLSEKGEQMREILAWGLAVRMYKGEFDMDRVLYALMTHGVNRVKAKKGLSYAMNTLPTSENIMLTAQIVADVLDNGPVADYILPMDMEFFGDS